MIQNFFSEVNFIKKLSYQCNSNNISIYHLHLTFPCITAEMLNGRLAMMGILGTTVFEIISGHPVVQMVGLR